MRDIVFLAVVIGFFALSVLFVKAFRAVEVNATGGRWLLTGVRVLRCRDIGPRGAPML